MMIWVARRTRASRAQHCTQAGTTAASAHSGRRCRAGGDPCPSSLHPPCTAMGVHARRAESAPHAPPQGGSGSRARHPSTKHCSVRTEAVSPPCRRRARAQNSAHQPHEANHHLVHRHSCSPPRGRCCSPATRCSTNPFPTGLRKLEFLKAAQRVLEEEEGSGYACHPRTCEAWQCVWRTAIALQRPSSRAAAPVPRHALIVLHFPALHCPQTAAAPGSPSRLRAGPRPARAVRRCLREIFGADVAVQRTV